MLKRIDLALTCAFAIEAILKIITTGFWFNGSKSYLRDSWNILDFSIVVFSSLGLIMRTDFKTIKILRFARILRPLRLI